MFLQQRYSLISKHTVGTSTIGNDFLIVGQLVEPRFQLINWNGAGFWNVSRSIFQLGSNVQDEDIPYFHML
jgi:hypothetical protein